MLEKLLAVAKLYLDGQCELRMLEEEVVGMVAVAPGYLDEQAVAWADQLDINLIELGEGIIDEEEFQRQLKRYLKMYGGGREEVSHADEVSELDTTNI